MEIPYTVNARPDTGLWNAKVGIWLFLASEVMLFGGLFSAYIFLRLGAEHWPHGLLNVPVGTMNTAVLIVSSVTVVLAWASLKMRRFAAYKAYMAVTILCGILFLVVKLAYEYPQKFHHCGIVFVNEQAAEKYRERVAHLAFHETKTRPEDGKQAGVFEGIVPGEFEVTGHLHGTLAEAKEHGKYVITPDSADHWRFDWQLQQLFHPDHEHETVEIDAKDVKRASMFTPGHNNYFAVYFTITGLHGLHVLGGVLVFMYFLSPFGARLYHTNPEHLANRIEVSGLFWHFVDLVWIFVFPIFYLL
jgi:cytochrome c oxidase subunit 3